MCRLQLLCLGGGGGGARPTPASFCPFCPVAGAHCHRELTDPSMVAWLPYATRFSVECGHAGDSWPWLVVKEKGRARGLYLSNQSTECSLSSDDMHTTLGALCPAGDPADHDS